MLAFLHVALFFEGAVALECLGKNGTFECCNGYMWNDVTKDCSTRCLPGYFGPNCTRHCSPGRYGEGCAHQCIMCEKTLCNVSFGCPMTTTETPRLARTEQFQGFITRNLPMKSQENNYEDENTANIWQILSLCFSVGIFAVIISVLVYKHTCKILFKTKGSPQTENNGSMNADKNYIYQALNDKTVYSGGAKVQINLNTVKNNFSIILNTEESVDEDALHLLENMKSKGPSVWGASVNRSVKYYETVC
ncbi:uncharacterized protein LOC134252505 [Saccostrea cucullata]|uniref:uncharacterized protein LOC134252505 n=1 Tax=Saccostrea cuccullata TaxID=36930 RepID=UPI002ED53D2C